MFQENTEMRMSAKIRMHPALQLMAAVIGRSATTESVKTFGKREEFDTAVTANFKNAKFNEPDGAGIIRVESNGSAIGYWDVAGNAGYIVSSPKAVNVDIDRIGAVPVSKADGNLKRTTESTQPVGNGDQVRIKKDSPYYDGDEVFTVSQCDGDKCWIGDKDERGWSINPKELERVSDDDGNLKRTTESTQPVGNGDQVRIKKDSPYYDGDEVFTVSQCDGDKCWIGDKDERGWSINPKELERVSDDDDLEEAARRARGLTEGDMSWTFMASDEEFGGKPVARLDIYNDRYEYEIAIVVNETTRTADNEYGSEVKIPSGYHVVIAKNKDYENEEFKDFTSLDQALNWVYSKDRGIDWTDFIGANKDMTAKVRSAMENPNSVRRMGKGGSRVVRDAVAEGCTVRVESGHDVGTAWVLNINKVTKKAEVKFKSGKVKKVPLSNLTRIEDITPGAGSLANTGVGPKVNDGSVAPASPTPLPRTFRGTEDGGIEGGVANRVNAYSRPGQSQAVNYSGGGSSEQGGIDDRGAGSNANPPMSQDSNPIQGDRSKTESLNESQRMDLGVL
jgi:hypothetical protein